jgi:hypothetical protein
MTERAAQTDIATGEADAAQSIGREDIARKLKAVRLPRYSGAQMREKVSEILPAIKAERRKRAKGAGRKHTYTRERFLAVLERMGGGETQGEALKAENISTGTWHGWLERADGREDEARYCREAHARAKLAIAELTFEESLEAPKRLYEMAMKGAGIVDSAMVGAAKLYSDSLRFYAGKLNPAAYGEDKSAMPTVNVTNNSLTINGRDLDATQRDQLRALLTAARGNDGGVIDG